MAIREGLTCDPHEVSPARQAAPIDRELVVRSTGKWPVVQKRDLTSEDIKERDLHVLWVSDGQRKCRRRVEWIWIDL